jgi:hypothetical protein
MTAAVLAAKQNKGGWQNRSGAAERSIQVATFAANTADGVRGLWGSLDVNYFIHLELRYLTLRRAADTQYPPLAKRIQLALETGL